MFDLLLITVILGAPGFAPPTEELELKPSSARDHCVAPEQVAFSCSMGEKVLSICASADQGLSFRNEGVSYTVFDNDHGGYRAGRRDPPAGRGDGQAAL